MQNVAVTAPVCDYQIVTPIPYICVQKKWNKHWLLRLTDNPTTWILKFWICPKMPGVRLWGNSQKPVSMSSKAYKCLRGLIATILTSTTLKGKGTSTCRLLYLNRVEEILCKIGRNTFDSWSKRPFSAVVARNAAGGYSCCHRWLLLQSTGGVWTSEGFPSTAFKISLPCQTGICELLWN